MAKGTGTYGAYSGMKPVNIDWGGMLNHADERAFRKRQEARSEEERKFKRQREISNKVGMAVSALKQDISGVQSWDEAVAKGIDRARQEIMNLVPELEKNPNDIKLNIKLANLQKYPEHLKQKTEAFKTYMEQGAKGLQDGSLSPHLNKDYVDKANALVQSNLFFGMDEQGFPLAIMDKNGDGDFEEYGYQGVISGMQLPPFKKRTDLKKYISGFKDRYGTYEEKYDDVGNYLSKEFKGLKDNNIENIKGEVNEAFGDSDNITDFAQSALADSLGIDPATIRTKEDFENVKNKVVDKILGSFDTKEASTFNYGARSADRNRALQWSRENRLSKGSNKKDEANYLRTLVDGTIAGDAQSLGSWKGAIVGKTKEGEIRVSDVERVDDRIIFEFNDGTVKEYETSDPDKLKGELASLARYKEKPDVAMKTYEEGSPLREYTTSEPNNVSRIKVEKEFRENIKSDGSMSKDNALSILKSNGFNNVTKGGWFNKEVKVAQGDEQAIFDVSTKQGVKELKDFIFNNSQTTESVGFDPTKF